jgi:phosphoglycerate dehydrogenase-like enzyme
VLVTARAFWVSGQAAEAALREAGCEVVRSSRAGPLTEEELIDALRGCDAVIASSDPYNARIFAACPDLKIVARCGVGTDSVDMAAAAEAGVVATNTPGAMSEAVADFTFGLMLCIARRLHEGDALMRRGGWDEFRGSTVCGKTLGLVGVGRIGRAVAERAAGFRMRVLAYDPAVAANQPPAPALSHPSASSTEATTSITSTPPPIELTDLETLLRESDYVSAHAPATPETTGMFNEARFAQMKRTAYFINTARGALVNEADLIAALENETIAGAALDVYAKEPLPADHPLRRAPRCLLEPHNAFNALESTQEMSRQSAVTVIDLLQGRRPENVCNPAVIDSAQLRTRR